MADILGLSRLWRQPTDSGHSDHHSDLVIMVHPGRCGSTVLGHLIDQSKKIKWDGEIFTPSRKLEIPVDDNQKVSWREFIEQRQNNSHRPMLGIELKTSQLITGRVFNQQYEDAFRNLMELTQYPPIFLFRENHIERMVSSLRARETRTYSYKEDQEKPPEVSVTFPRYVRDNAYGLRNREISAWLQEVEVFQSDLAERIEGLGGVLVTFEKDVASDPLVGFRKILKALDIPIHSPTFRYKRIDPRPTHMKIANLDELRGWLTPAQVARYLP